MWARCWSHDVITQMRNPFFIGSHHLLLDGDAVNRLNHLHTRTIWTPLIERLLDCTFFYGHFLNKHSYISFLFFSLHDTINK